MKNLKTKAIIVFFSLLLLSNGHLSAGGIAPDYFNGGEGNGDPRGGAGGGGLGVGPADGPGPDGGGPDPDTPDDPDKKPDKQCPAEGTSNPIHIPSGNKFIEEALYQGGGSFPLKFAFYYNSRNYDRTDQTVAVYGRWTHSYGQHLRINKVGADREIIEMVRPDGRSQHYEGDLNVLELRGGFYRGGVPGNVAPPLGGGTHVLGNLQRIIENAETSGYVYVSLAGIEETYDANGWLIQVRNLHGNGTHQITYDLPQVVSTNGDDENQWGTITITSLERAESLTIYVRKLDKKWVVGPYGEPITDDYERYHYLPRKVVTPGGLEYNISASTRAGSLIQVPILSLAEEDFYNIAPAFMDSVHWPDNTYRNYSYDTQHVTTRAALESIKVYQANGTEIFQTSYSYTADQKAYISQIGNLDISERDEIYYNSADISFSVTNANGHADVYTFRGNPLSYSHSLVGVEGTASSNCGGSNNSYDYDEQDRPDLATNTDTGLVRDNDYFTDPNLPTIGLLDKVTYVGVDDGNDRIKDYDWYTDTSAYRLIKQAAEPGIIKDYTYEYGRLSTYQEIDTKINPAGYIREHATTRLWTYDYTYHGNDSDGLHRIDTLTITGPRNAVTVNRYDGQGNLVGITNPLGKIVSYTGHNEYALPTLIYDVNNVPATLTYTVQGWLESITQEGHSQTFSYDNLGHLIRVESADGSFLEYAYTDGGRLASITNHLNEKQTIDRIRNGDTEEFITRTFDGSSVKKSERSELYDSLGRLWKAYDIGGSSSLQVLQEYNYDNNAPVYDGDGMIVYGANSEGNVETITDGRNGQIKKIFDAMGRQTSIEDLRDTNPSDISMGYDYQDRLASVTDQEGITTSYVYDGFGNLLITSNPNTGTTTYHYDIAGNLTKKTDENSTAVLYSYDLLNRITTVDYPNQPDVTYHYDQTLTNGEANYGVGELTAVSSSDGDRTDWIYDRKGDLVKDIRSISGKVYTTSYLYNEAGKLTSIQYPSGNTIDYNRINTVVDNIQWREGAKTIISNIRYEPFGPLADFTYGNQKLHNTVFDDFYRVDTIASGDVLSLDYSYDNRSDIELITDLMAGGRTQEFGYSALGFLDYASGDYGVFNYTYDPLGNRESRVRNAGEMDEFSEIINYAEDEMGVRLSHRLESIVGTGAGAQNRTFVYTGTGSLSTDTAASKEFIYDDSGRLVTIKSGATTVADYHHNPLGQRDKKITVEGERRFIYNLNGQLLYEESIDGSFQRDYIYLDDQLVSVLDSQAAAANPYQYSFTLAAGSNTATVEINYDTRSFKLVESNGHTVEATVDEQNWNEIYYPSISRLDTSFVWHDGNGGYVQGSSGKYDDELPVLSLNHKFEYEYYIQYYGLTPTANPHEYSGSGVTAYLEPNNPVVVIDEDLHGSRTVTVNWDRIEYGPYYNNLVVDKFWALLPEGGYVNGSLYSTGLVVINVKVGAPYHHWYNMTGVTSLGQGQTAGGGLFYVHNDHLNTPQVITDDSGAVVWEMRQKPFGEAELVTSSIENNIRFPGQYYDGETGLHYNYYRTYDPSTGRYITSDPIGLAGGLNTYAYVVNNPLTRIDPTGLDWVYSQSSGQVTQVTNGQTQQGQGGTGYAGSGQGVNNPAMQNVPNVGPIPQGTYDIGQQRNSPNTGPGILPLTPQPGTNTYGRDNFQIHGDNRQGNQSASQGCMVFDRNTRNQISNSGDNVLRVVP